MRPVTVTAHDLASLFAAHAAEVTIHGDETTTVTGITLDSRAVQPGDVYAALPGATTHGAKFAASAAALGASAIFTDPAGADLARAAGVSLPLIAAAHPRELLGRVAAAIYGNPSHALTMIGLTGTNGKTTTAYLINGALTHLGHTPGLIGTNGTFVHGERLPTQRTTPESPDLQGIFALMLERGCGAVCMEVSSHALTLHRVDGIVFDVAGFTNLSQDHLDFHPTLEEYFVAKASLFTPVRSRRAVVCVDDEWGMRLAGMIRAQGGEYGLVSFTTDPQKIADADYLARAASSPEHAALGGTVGLDFELVARDGTVVSARSPLPGRHNMANSTLAMLMLHTGLNISLSDAAQGIAHAGQVPGRMECINAATAEPDATGAYREPKVFVDFAHSADSIVQACETLRPVATARGGRIIIVIGAGGDRDATKRPAMGSAAVEGADVVIVTDDNPRSEAPETIRAAVKAGAYAALQKQAQDSRSLGEVVEIPERRNAIIEAVRRAHPEDVVLLAGKGSESGQEVNGVVTPFDDRDEARTALQK